MIEIAPRNGHCTHQLSIKSFASASSLSQHFRHLQLCHPKGARDPAIAKNQPFFYTLDMQSIDEFLTFKYPTLSTSRSYVVIQCPSTVVEDLECCMPFDPGVPDEFLQDLAGTQLK